MNDLLPDALEVWQRVEAAARRVLAAYGYREIRFPLVERTELFARSIGEHTDIVEKEMYTFEDRNGDRLTLRPEGTAGCVRAAIENGLIHNQTQHLWYQGPMFRHERPQKGRYRQFHQIGAEVFGIASADADAELMLLTSRLWRELGVSDVQLEINSLGDAGARAAYRDALVAYLRSHAHAMDEEHRRRLEANPLRVLDSKAPGMSDIIAGAPSLLDFLDDAAREHFEALRGYLEKAGQGYKLNPRLVRGLDYYNRTVFEWTTTKLGAQSAVCAGGRYDGLVEMLGGRPTPATGFALGLERVVELVSASGDPAQQAALDAYLAVPDDGLRADALVLAERLRDAGITIQCHCGGGSLKSQLKRADRSGARLALLYGEQEATSGSVTVKDLRAAGAEQVQVKITDLAARLRDMVGSKGART